MKGAPLDLARRALGVAALLSKHGFLEEAAARAYYAAFYAARAALLHEGEELRTHKGVITTFNRVFVRTNRLPSETGRILGALHRLRTDADYDEGTEITEAEANDALLLAQQFVAAVDSLLAPQLPSTG